MIQSAAATLARQVRRAALQVLGDAGMKHKFRDFVNMEFSFYMECPSSVRRRFSAMATVSAMAKAMLAESERKPA